ncbi:aldo-keto reductase [Ramicandelaber brevisporus]|nr:aldo-keto reductase [Ramicandelaber brevisporus]
MPLIGFGSVEVKEEHILAAFEAGYRHIDGAPLYLNEDLTGRAIKASGIPREQLWITSKLWNTDHHDAAAALDRTLKDLGTDYVDLYLIHYPVQAEKPAGKEGDFCREMVNERRTDFAAVWKQMEALVDSGKARSIGVSNFKISHLEEILKVARIIPAVNQVEMHPYFKQKELFDYCRSRGIHLTAYSPFGAGGEPKLTADPVVAKIAEKHGVHPSNVLISWHLHRDCSVIPRSATIKNIQSNLKVVELDEEDIKAIEDIKFEKRYLDPTQFFGPNVAFVDTDP